MDKINILALEDEEHNIKSFFRMMQVLCEPVSITIERNYEQAIEEYNKNQYDALIVDLKLEGEDKQGEDFIREIRKNDTEIPIYILTGVEYDKVLREKFFVEKYKIKRWVKKPIYAGDFCDYLMSDFKSLLSQR